MTKQHYPKPSTRRFFCTTSSPKKKPRLRADQQANRKRKYRNNLENSGCRLKRRVDKGLQESQQKTVGSRSISRVLSWTTIPLGMLLPACSSSLPGSNASHAMRFPIWPCFRWGLPCRPCYHVRGELLPRRFTLAVPGFPGLGRFAFCCTFRHLTVPGR